MDVLPDWLVWVFKKLLVLEFFTHNSFNSLQRMVRKFQLGPTAMASSHEGCQCVDHIFGIWHLSRLNSRWSTGKMVVVDYLFCQGEQYVLGMQIFWPLREAVHLPTEVLVCKGARYLLYAEYVCALLCFHSQKGERIL